MMEVFYAVLGVLLVGLMMTCMFVCGALFMKMSYRDAQEDARYDAMRYEYYRMAGTQRPTDPRPYVPPRPVTPRRRPILPGMSALDRLMKEGKRGTVMWRAGDRQKAG